MRAGDTGRPVGRGHRGRPARTARRLQAPMRKPNAGHAGSVSQQPISSRYADAFWRLAVIPAVLTGVAVLVVDRPSTPAIVALVVLLTVGSLAEALIFRDLRHMWSGEAPGPIGLAFEGLGHSTSLYNALSLAFMAIVFSLLAYVVKGRSLGMSVPDAMLAGCGFFALALLLGAVVERIHP